MESAPRAVSSSEVSVETGQYPKSKTGLLHTKFLAGLQLECHSQNVDEDLLRVIFRELGLGSFLGSGVRRRKEGSEEGILGVGGASCKFTNVHARNDLEGDRSHHRLKDQWESFVVLHEKREAVLHVDVTDESRFPSAQLQRGSG